MAYTSIDDPSVYFQITLYTGNGTTTNNVTNTGNSNLQPDLVWIKQRSATQDHVVTDSSRDGEVASGTNLVLTPNTDEAEASSTGFGINYATNGINFDAAWAKVNASSQTYVAWQWKANGGTTASNSDGSITSTVQANQDAGFSIVTFTGNGTDGATVGHGLGAVPAMVLFKCRDTGNTDWRVYHQSISPTNALSLNSAGAQYGASGVFGGTFTSTLLKVENDTGANRNTSPMIAYCFAEKQGYSKFGKYVGNGNANGAFVYTGFKPAWVMVKRSDSADSWAIFDNKRSDSGGFNVIDKHLRADTSGAEYDPGGVPAVQIDILSNGFKQREANGQVNASGGSYIYMAFAENPFTTSTGVPTTAR